MQWRKIKLDNFTMIEYNYGRSFEGERQTECIKWIFVKTLYFEDGYASYGFYKLLIQHLLVWQTSMLHSPCTCSTSTSFTYLTKCIASILIYLSDKPHCFIRHLLVWQIPLLHSQFSIQILHCPVIVAEKHYSISSIDFI